MKGDFDLSEQEAVPDIPAPDLGDQSTPQHRGGGGRGDPPAGTLGHPGVQSGNSLRGLSLDPAPCLRIGGSEMPRVLSNLCPPIAAAVDWSLSRSRGQLSEDRQEGAAPGG